MDSQSNGLKPLSMLPPDRATTVTLLCHHSLPSFTFAPASVKFLCLLHQIFIMACCSIPFLLVQIAMLKRECELRKSAAIQEAYTRLPMVDGDGELLRFGGLFSLCAM